MNRARVEARIRPQFTKVISKGRDGRILVPEAPVTLELPVLAAALNRDEREEWRAELEDGYPAMEILPWVWPKSRTLLGFGWESFGPMSTNCSLMELPGSRRRRYICRGAGVGEEGSVLAAALDPGPEGIPLRRAVEAILGGQDPDLRVDMFVSLPSSIENHAPAEIPRAAVQAGLWCWMESLGAGADEAWANVRDDILRDAVHANRKDRALAALREALTGTMKEGLGDPGSTIRPDRFTHDEKQQILAVYMRQSYREP